MSKQFKVNIINWSGQQLSLNLNDSSSFLRHDGTWATPAGGPASATGVTGLQAAGFSPPFTGLVQITGTNGIGVGQSNNIITISGAGLNYIYNTGISSGVNTQFIPFPVTLGSNPTVVASLRNDSTDAIVPFQISGAVTSGFWAIFANTIPTTGYVLNIQASTTSLTGSIASITTNNVTNNITITGTSGTFISVSGGPPLISGTLTGLGGISITQTGSTIYVNNSPYGNMGTGQGIFSGVLGGTSEFYSLAVSTGLQINQSAGGPITYSTWLGTQVIVNITGTVPMQSGNFFYQAMSGTLTPGTWLGVATVNVVSFSGCNFVAKLWNGNTGTGIFAMQEVSLPTLGFGAGGTGVLVSGNTVLDFTSIITTPNITPIALHVASTITGCRILSTTTHFNTGEGTTGASYMNFIRLY